jgi:integrase
VSAQALAAPAAPPGDGNPASWFWSLIDAGFLAEAGFDAQRKVLFPPAGHPLLGWSQCRVAGCAVVIFTTQAFCSGCKRRFAAAGLPEKEFSAIPRPADQPRRRMVQSCRVPGCQRPWIDAPRALCSAHHWQKNRLRRCSLEEFLARTDLEPLPSLGACAVAACYRDASVIRSMLCHAHNCRMLDARRADPGLDTDHWLAAQTAIPEGAEVSFRGLPDLVVAQLLFGLQQRCRDGALTQHTRLRALTSWLRAERVSSLDALSAEQASGAGVDRLTRGPLTTMIAAVRRARMTAESEYAKDRWDMAALGMTGFIDFGGISQPWLRETAKRWVRHTAPQRRGERAGNNLRSQVLYLELLSESLRSRADRGNDPAGLGREDVEFFLARAGRKERLGEISAHKRRQVIITAGSILKCGRLLGLTRPGEPMNGLADDFALIRGDLPARPERSEAGRDLPPEVMRQLCAHLDWLDGRVEREMRVGIELLIDTGRRPDEACELDYDCLACDNDGKPVLVYCDSKENRPQRQLPLHQATADLIRGQQARVRSRYPDAPAAELKLLPSILRNPRGRKAISADSLSENNRAWVDAMPEIRLDDGTVFDKSKIFLYAYRHTYAQRHADAGVAVDVLAMLLDHDTLEATRGYYRVRQKRLRKAVDTVAQLQFDRHGNRAWKQAGQLLDAQRTRQAVGEVAVAFGRCSEPSNVSAGGGQCPLRFRCLGCEHFSTDVSYLPELRSYLDDLLRTRERLQAMAAADDWAKREALPSEEEITRLRRLIRRVSENLESLTPQEQAEIHDAVTAVRKTRQAFLGIPRVRQPLPDVRPERPA